MEKSFIKTNPIKPTYKPPNGFPEFLIINCPALARSYVYDPYSNIAGLYWGLP
jgi:hypothetical protein